MSTRAFLRLRTDWRGAVVIELALAAPVMAAIVIGLSDMSRAYSLKLVVEQAAQRTIEKIEVQKSVATNYNTAITSEATLALTAAGYSTGNTITPDSWVECSANGTTWTRKTNFTDACASTEMTARYVSVSISRKYTPMFAGRVWPNADSTGKLTVTGYSSVRIQ